MTRRRRKPKSIEAARLYSIVKRVVDERGPLTAREVCKLLGVGIYSSWGEEEPFTRIDRVVIPADIVGALRWLTGQELIRSWGIKGADITMRKGLRQEWLHGNLMYAPPAWNREDGGNLVLRAQVSTLEKLPWLDRGELHAIRKFLQDSRLHGAQVARERRDRARADQLAALQRPVGDLAEVRR